MSVDIWEDLRAKVKEIRELQKRVTKLYNEWGALVPEQAERPAPSAGDGPEPACICGHDHGVHVVGILKGDTGCFLCECENYDVPVDESGHESSVDAEATEMGEGRSESLNDSDAQKTVQGDSSDALRPSPSVDAGANIRTHAPACQLDRDHKGPCIADFGNGEEEAPMPDVDVDDDAALIALVRHLCEATKVGEVTLTTREMRRLLALAERPAPGGGDKREEHAWESGFEEGYARGQADGGTSAGMHTTCTCEACQAGPFTGPSPGGTADAETNDLMAVAYEQGREDERANIGKTWTYFRCRRCGRVEAPYEVEPGDVGTPQTNCGCYMGPDWEPVVVGARVAPSAGADVREALRRLRDLLELVEEWQPGVEMREVARTMNRADAALADSNTDGAQK